MFSSVAGIHMLGLLVLKFRSAILYFIFGIILSFMFPQDWFSSLHIFVGLGVGRYFEKNAEKLKVKRKYFPSAIRPPVEGHESITTVLYSLVVVLSSVLFLSVDFIGEFWKNLFLIGLFFAREQMSRLFEIILNATDRIFATINDFDHRIIHLSIYTIMATCIYNMANVQNLPQPFSFQATDSLLQTLVLSLLLLLMVIVRKPVIIGALFLLFYPMFVLGFDLWSFFAKMLFIVLNLGVILLQKVRKI